MKSLRPVSLLTLSACFLSSNELGDNPDSPAADTDLTHVDSDEDAVDEEPEETVSPTPQVFYVSRNVDGERYPDDLVHESDLCPEDAPHLGGTGYTAACLDESIHGFVVLQSTPEGESYPTEIMNEADMCPNNSTFLGGNTFYSVCGYEDPVTQVELFADTDGLSVNDADEVGDVCPADTTWVGNGFYNSAICKLEGAHTVVRVDQSATGKALGAIPLAEMCPADWKFVGTFFDAPVCIGDMGTMVTLTRNAEGASQADLEDEASICPSDWTYLGQSWGVAQCFQEASQSVAYLSRDRDGQTYPDDLESASSLCPNEWTYMGMNADSAICVK